MRKRKHYVTIQWEPPYKRSLPSVDVIYSTSSRVAKIENHSELMPILRASVIEADSDEQSNQDTNTPELENGLIRHRNPPSSSFDYRRSSHWM